MILETRHDRADVRAFFRPPAWVTGGLSTDDAIFLIELVEALQPGTVVEIGLAAGTSSAAILFALDRLAGAHSLTSFDIAARCYFDRSRAVGAAVAEMLTTPITPWRIHTHGATPLELEPLTPIAFALIDANHKHPAPLVDLLTLAPYLAPGAWVALHDIALATVYPQFAAEGRGAEWLFASWPFEKFSGGRAAPNIGAIRVPIPIALMAPWARTLLGRPWETAIDARTLARVNADLEGGQP